MYSWDPLCKTNVNLLIAYENANIIDYGIYF